MEIEKRDIATLIPYARNAKKHDDNQITQIAASIKEFGFNDPVEITADNVIIAGHGRVLAAQKLGITEIPVVVHDHLSENQRKAYTLLNNRLAEIGGGWDTELLKLELEDLPEFEFPLFNEIIALNEEETILEGLIEDDELPETGNKESKVETGQIYQLGNHRLMCGDSAKIEDVKLLLNGEKVDMVFTDPPYGVSYSNKNEFLNQFDKGNRNQTPIENDNLNLANLSDLLYSVFCIIRENLNDYSSYYITSPQGGELLMMMMMMMEKANIPLRHMLIWAKNNHVLGRCDYNYKHEPILYGWVKRHKFYGNGEQKTSVWNFDKPLKNDLHPTMKPIALIENAILNSTEKNMFILDLFGGSGSTLIACEKTQRKCFMMELDTHYCSVIINRWEKFTGKKAELIE